MKKATKKVPFVPGLVRDTPVDSAKRAREQAKDPVAEPQRVQNKPCPICGQENATISVQIYIGQVSIGQRCFNAYVQPVQEAQRAAGGLLDLINRFL